MRASTGRTACYCGSRRFSTTITLEIHHVPVKLSGRGALSYDDTKGTTDGWDTSTQPEVSCAKCGHLWDLEQESEAEDPKGRPAYRLSDKEGCR